MDQTLRRLRRIIPIAALAVILVGFAVGLTRDPSRIPTDMVDAPAPVFDLPPIQDYERGFSSADLQGQVSLVNIFASWCVSCLYEHPVLMDLEARGEAPPIYGLAWKDPPADEREASGDPGATTAWLERHGNPYTAVGDDAEGRVAIDFAVTGAPETFVIDKQGRIRYKHPGVITPENWRQIFQPLIAELERE